MKNRDKMIDEQMTPEARKRVEFCEALREALFAELCCEVREYYDATDDNGEPIEGEMDSDTASAIAAQILDNNWIQICEYGEDTDYIDIAGGRMEGIIGAYFPTWKHINEIYDYALMLAEAAAAERKAKRAAARAKKAA
jgi:hypothetical protein